jgi:hypothetical protein
MIERAGQLASEKPQRSRKLLRKAGRRLERAAALADRALRARRPKITPACAEALRESSRDAAFKANELADSL